MPHSATPAAPVRRDLGSDSDSDDTPRLIIGIVAAVLLIGLCLCCRYFNRRKVAARRAERPEDDDDNAWDAASATWNTVGAGGGLALNIIGCVAGLVVATIMGHRRPDKQEDEEKQKGVTTEQPLANCTVGGVSSDMRQMMQNRREASEAANALLEVSVEERIDHSRSVCDGHVDSRAARGTSGASGVGYPEEDALMLEGSLEHSGSPTPRNTVGGSSSELHQLMHAA